MLPSKPRPWEVSHLPPSPSRSTRTKLFRELRESARRPRPYDLLTRVYSRIKQLVLGLH